MNRYVGNLLLMRGVFQCWLKIEKPESPWSALTHEMFRSTFAVSTSSACR
jgi:hypothetical protein